MALFQNTIIKVYAPSYKEEIEKAYILYKQYFFDKETQENILKSKEEQFQEGFLRELFVKVLGYTLNPSPNYNLITEQKNATDAKKADGAILVNGDVAGVIELKDHKTVDLKKIEDQAFKYRRNHRNARYVITSNFEKLRFYIDNAVDFEEFNLFELTAERFTLLWLCLAYENIQKGLPLQMKSESVGSEDKITKQLYKEYSEFKRQLFANLEELNPQYDRLTLFKKSQKLLDRFLFILFAEDSGLLPANSVIDIVEQWKKLKELDEYRPLYDRLKKYFGYMNTGHKGKKHEIFAYNGGLFYPDEILDNVLINDDVLEQNLVKIANYDFASEVDVNILGHIFENSLTEIEEVANAIENNTEIAQTSKRKKDGVFYTPRYITIYIVENTVGKLCNEKKQELGLDQLEYFDDDKKKRLTEQQKKRAKDFGEKIDEYRKWLLELTICDPACGSGAFLNAALDYLIAEHRLADEMESKVFRIPLVFNEVENSILENNLYGVDINEESIEIAKLSLWLRTAKPHRKLNSLSDNIKCGNSLIDDSEVAGSKAFCWEKEFPHVFERGGFDVVIGNPPYVFARENFSDSEKKYFSNSYQSAKYQVNTYILFIEKSFKLLKRKGKCGLIIPDSWLMIYSGEGLRKYILEECSINKIVSLVGKSFEDANVETVILVAEKIANEANNEIEILENEEKTSSFNLLHLKLQDNFKNNEGAEFTVFSDEKNTSLIDKIKANSKDLDILCSVKAGLQAYERGKGIPPQTEEDVRSRPFDFKEQHNSDTYKYLEGSDVLRYGLSWSGTWLWYGSHLAAPRTFDLFSGEKVIIREITGKFPHCIISSYSDNTFLFNRSNIAVINRMEFNISLKYISVILNSTLMSYYFEKNTAKAKRKLFPKIILNDLRLFPIKELALSHQQPFIEKADQMLSLNADLHAKRQRFIKRLTNNFDGIKITGALERFDEGDFKQFLAELKKQKITLSLVQQDEWEEYFDQYKTECNHLSETIAATDRQIDEMVYRLYDLTDEEIAIVEGRK
ncbi:Eco57I restriction-modification methylase domain-containing protein [Dysgonomonas mossii]|uniref:Eco57I restriction-modification methylase domain-containing protein n=1 Tax=Dysgonomonas mossii TaxID=163665 RepID=UPI00399622B7